MLNKAWEVFGLKYCPFIISSFLHQNWQQICYSFSIVYVSHIEAKKQSITFKYTLISTILNPKYSHYCTETIEAPLHFWFSQVFKIKLDTHIHAIRTRGGKFGSQVLSIHYFLVSASGLTTNLLFIPHSLCQLYRSEETIDFLQIYLDLSYSEPKLFLNIALRQ